MNSGDKSSKYLLLTHLWIIAIKYQSINDTIYNFDKDLTFKNPKREHYWLLSALFKTQKIPRIFPVYARLQYDFYTTIHGIIKFFDPRHGSPLFWRLIFLAEICSREVNTLTIFGHPLLQPRII